jgi:hypothetical protein
MKINIGHFLAAFGGESNRNRIDIAALSAAVVDDSFMTSSSKQSTAARVSPRADQY